MPKVRASSGMIGTTRRPMFSSRHRLRNNRVNPIVVLTGNSPDPIRSSWKTSSAGSESGRFTATRRVGITPPSAFRRSIMYWYSIESSLGLKYGGSSSSSDSDGISSWRWRRSRNSSNWSRVIFLIWCVALRPSKPGPNVHPLTVLHRMTVGRPLPRFSVAAL